uniref:L1 transposable element RRM domain-containing protein n=1 Tax=Latimeria chalumnae TaxID=7897 RepID=H3AWF3_LATCH
PLTALVLRSVTGDVPTDIKNILLMLNNITVATTSSSTTLNELKDMVSTLSQRMATVEQRISNVEDSQQKILEMSTELQKQITALTEGAEKGKLISFLQEVLPELLQLSPGTALDIKRVHHLLAPKPAVGQKPRLFIIKFRWYPIKEQLFTAAKELGALEWQGNRIQVLPDLSCDLQERCSHFLPVKQKLRECGIKYGLFYLALLKLTIEGETKTFSDP